MATCNICVDTYNRSTRKQVTCKYCDFEACTSCVGRVLCESSGDPQCMNCKKAWDIDFLLANFTKKFVKETLKSHRENQLFEREIAMLPATQPAVERTIARRKLEDVKQRLIQQREELKMALANISLKIQKQHDAIYELTFRSDGDLVKDKRAFVRKCPCEGCKGFLSTQWKCGICENYTCSECLEVKGREKNVEHVCKPENVETANLIARDTKPCPGCGEMIHKISGCSQMFCTSCHAVWDWNTCRMETGVIHNPHYFEFQRRNGTLPRPIGDQPCGGLPDFYILSANLKRLGKNIYNFEGYNIATYLQLMHHTHEVTRRAYIVNNLTDNLDLRIRFMLNEITEEHFKRILQQREKANNKKREIEQVIAMAYTVSVDTLYALAAATTVESASECLQQLHKLLEFAEAGMDRIQEKYGGVVPSMMLNFAAKALEHRQRNMVN